jgi:hypothetical protein
MQSIVPFCVIASFLSFSVTYAADIDPADHIIVAYQLSAEQEDNFSVTDGQAADFWGLWEGTGADVLDYAHLIPSIHGKRGCTPDECPSGGSLDPCSGPDGFDQGDDDAQFFLRAAWGEKGLYLLAIALDDEFVGLSTQFENDPEDPDQIYAGNEHWMNDCFDFALDIYDSETQKSHFTCRPSQETLTYRQYQLRFGGPELPKVIRVCDPKPDWTPNADCTSWILNYDQVSIEEAKQKYNLNFEIFPFGEKKKAQEWLIPWGEVGSAGITRPSSGQRVALAFNYNDFDPDAYNLSIVMPDFLFFREFGNQFTFKEVAREGGCRTGQNWGDIEMGGRLDEVIGGSITASPMRISRKLPAPAAGKSSYFSISGQRLGATGAARANSIFLKRASATGASIDRTVSLHK